MMDKNKGLGGWVEIFRGGRQVDSKGHTHDGDRLIRRAVETFEPRHHAPPLVLGHPRDNAPAYGWVSGLRTTHKNGRAVLEARFAQVAPALASAVRRGLYKKRSAGFYPDGRLRHVGFLGAVPPAVKGLADIAFQEPNQPPAAPTAHRVGRDGSDGKGEHTLLKTLTDFAALLMNREGRDHAPAVSDKVDPAAKTETAREERRRAVETEIDRMVQSGQMPPALAASGLADFLCGLDAPLEFHFSDTDEAPGDDEGKAKDPVTLFLRLIAKAAALDLFRETAVRGNEKTLPSKSDAEDEALAAKIAAKVSG